MTPPPFANFITSDNVLNDAHIFSILGRILTTFHRMRTGNTIQVEEYQAEAVDQPCGLYLLPAAAD